MLKPPGVEDDEELSEHLPFRRPIHRMQSFIDEYGKLPKHKSAIRSFKDATVNYFHSLTLVAIANSFVDSIPLIRCLKEYKIRNYLLGDILSGMTVAIMHIPQGKSNM